MHCCSLLHQQKQLPLTPHSSQEFPGQQDTDTGKEQRPGGRKKAPNHHLQNKLKPLGREGVTPQKHI